MLAIGLDGANWNLVDKWIADGKLPNLRRLKENGIGGTSKSCLPPLTVPNWKCYSTGKNPGNFGVFRFDRIDTESRSHTFHDYSDFDSPELWDYLNADGLTTGIINKPSTYPPKAVDGFMVSGGPDASDSEYRSLESGFTYPSALGDELQAAFDYDVHPTPMISPSETGDREVEAILDLIETRFQVARYLLDREAPDFLHLTIFYNMALQHYFWREEPVLRAWKVIDENLAGFIDDGHDLVIFSDHGTCRVDVTFYINVWLEENGYLTTEQTVDRRLRSLGFTRERALRIAKRLGMVDVLSKTVPERIQKVLPWEEGLKRDRVLSAVDWDETSVLASNQGPVYLTLDRDDAEYEPLRTELIERLQALSHPETGAHIVDAVHRGEELYSGPYAGASPDLVIEQGDNVHTSDAIGPNSWWANTGVWQGGNTRNGLFLFHGPSFRQGATDADAEIVDIAPTILHSMNVPVPDDMDGTVLDVFEDDADNAVTYRTPLSTPNSAARTESESVEQRLADLGYLE